MYTTFLGVRQGHALASWDMVEKIKKENRTNPGVFLCHKKKIEPIPRPKLEPISPDKPDNNTTELVVALVASATCGYLVFRYVL